MRNLLDLSDLVSWVHKWFVPLVKESKEQGVLQAVGYISWQHASWTARSKNDSWLPVFSQLKWESPWLAWCVHSFCWWLLTSLHTIYATFLVVMYLHKACFPWKLAWQWSAIWQCRAGYGSSSLYLAPASIWASLRWSTMCGDSYRHLHYFSGATEPCGLSSYCVCMCVCVSTFFSIVLLTIISWYLKWAFARQNNYVCISIKCDVHSFCELHGYE